MSRREIDIIWNISLICPWDCEFCCTDAVHVYAEAGNIIARENSLTLKSEVSKELLVAFGEKFPGIKPTKFDLALLKRQLEKKEPTFDQKLSILENLKGHDVKIDFAGGDPLACYENYLIIKKASQIFGKAAISITSTGAFIRRYGANTISEIISTYEFTYDEPHSSPAAARPMGYNRSNLRIAEEFSKLSIRTKAQLPIHAENSSPSKILEIYRDLCKAGINELLLMRTFPVGRGEKYLSQNNLSRSTIEKVIEEFRKIEDIDKTKIRLQCALKHLYIQKGAPNPCDLMHKSFGINFQGKLLISAWANNSAGLPISDDFVLGDLCKQSFDEISFSSKFMRYKERLDENFGHCKIFAFKASETISEHSLFEPTDPLYDSSL